MIKKLFAVLLLSAGFSFGQEYCGAWDEVLFLREPSVAAEALGRQYFLNTDDAFASVYNPALPAVTDKFDASYGNSHGNIYMDATSFRYEAINIPIKNLGVFSLSRRHYNNGYNLQGYLNGTIYHGTNTQSVYNLNYSRKLTEHLYAGAGFNYFTEQLFSYEYKLVGLNAGAFFMHSLNKSRTTEHNVTAGFVVNNLFTVGLKNPPQFLHNLVLPRFYTASWGYSGKLNPITIHPELTDISADLQIEYMHFLNSKTSDPRFSAGTQIILLDILSLRGGFYQSGKDYFTYGIGVNLPLFLAGIPVDLSVDYTRIPLPEYGMEPLYPETRRPERRNPESIMFNIRYQY